MLWVPSNAPKHPHPLMSRKFISGSLTAVLLFVGALLVTNGNFGALATGLVALFTSFSAANTVAGLVAPKAASPKAVVEQEGA